MPAEHLGELAELYALGTLEPMEAKRVQAHVRQCTSCAARVGEAEAAVFPLIQADSAGGRGAELPPLALEPRGSMRRTSPSRWAAIAAAFLIGLLPPSIAWMRERTAHPVVETQQAATAMLAGHFAHVSLRPRVAAAPQAKAIYPLEGGWVYVIVAAGPAVEVAAVRGGATSTVASLPSSTNVRTAFAKVSGNVDAVELIERGRIVALGTVAR